MQSPRDTIVSMNSIVALRDWRRYRSIRYRLDIYAQRGLQVILMPHHRHRPVRVRYEMRAASRIDRYRPFVVCISMSRHPAEPEMSRRSNPRRAPARGSATPGSSPAPIAAPSAPRSPVVFAHPDFRCRVHRGGHGPTATGSTRRVRGATGLHGAQVHRRVRACRVGLCERVERRHLPLHCVQRRPQPRTKPSRTFGTGFRQDFLCFA